MRGQQKPLEIHPPLAYCGACHFVTALSGEWSMVEGRLTWTSEVDLVPFRGPSLDGCTECGATLTSIQVEESPGGKWRERDLSTEDRAALIAASDAAWEATYGPIHRELS